MIKVPWKRYFEADNIVAITGAGVSIKSGLPSGPELCAKVVKSITNDLAFNKIHLDNLIRTIPLETVFQVLADNGLGEIIDIIISRINCDNPSTAHFALSQMAQKGKVKAIITFNFDTLHEQSLVGWTYIKKSVYGKTIIKEYQNDSNVIEIIKLHGSCETTGIISFSEYIRGFPHNLRQKIYNLIDQNYILILGYGGWDYDFSQMLQDFLTHGGKPKEVVWVDKYFPETGGRSDLINIMIKYGCKVESLKCDFDTFFEEYRIQQNDLLKTFNFPNINKQLNVYSKYTRINIILELYLLSTEVELAKDFLKNFDEIFYLDALCVGVIFERIGYFPDAKKYLKIAATQSTNYAKKLLAIIKLFRLPNGSINLLSQFKNIPIPEIVKPFCNMLEYGLSTDKGGLDRDFAEQLCEELPSLEKLKALVNNSHLIRFLIYVYSEIARLLYENNNFKGAFEKDKCALALAQILVDPELLMLTQGNVGVSYIGLAENDNENNEYWQLAKEYLERALKIPEAYNPVRYSLFKANLGLVFYELGEFNNAINTIEEYLPTLVKVSPNYSIHFFGKLSYIYISLYKTTKSIKYYDRSMELLTIGIEKVQELNDYDDFWVLKEAFECLLHSKIPSRKEKFEKLKKHIMLLKKEKDL